MPFAHVLLEEFSHPYTTKDLRQSDNEQSPIVIDEDLDNWIKGLHLSTLPKDRQTLLDIAEFMDGKIVTDIALAQDLISDADVRFNSPEKLFRLVIERLFKDESVEAQYKVIERLMMGEGQVLDKTLRALKAFRLPRSISESFHYSEPVPEQTNYSEECEEELTPDSVSTEDTWEGEISPHQFTMSLSSTGSVRSRDEALEEKCYDLSRNLTQTRSTAER